MFSLRSAPVSLIMFLYSLLPATVSILADGLGHVSSAGHAQFSFFSLCSGRYQMCLGVLFLPSTIKINKKKTFPFTMEWPCQFIQEEINKRHRMM